MSAVRVAELVVVGTSLGGLAALSVLLGSLEASFPAPVVVVQHRAPGGDGQSLAALLRSRTPLAVIETEDKTPLDGGTVYLAPADYHLLVECRGWLALSTDPPVRSARPSIDVLFETAAEAYGPAALGVLLTGASADGAAGVAAIKARGGRVLIEDPGTAESSTMPAAGIAAAAVDYVLPLEAMAAHVTSLVEGRRI
jgi:two-component system, chemotaxis family, protein-glutamate methylesterase/glutaminase